ncbi:MAG: microcin ABC transporter ATP-binding protein [Robiginitomaculum sp.]|nr:MAG: microcin ABC transporter ATP-binding protein [Robiginitomaculum sp.]
MSLLAINNLSLDIGQTSILHDVSLSISKGKIFGLAGQSGAGKSMTALSIMGLLPEAAQVRGTITLYGNDLLSRTERQMCAVRGRHVGMVFQEPMSALNPLHTIGAQVAETVRVHERVSRAEAYARAANMLDRVGLPPVRIPMDRFPHELSGGQRQRVVIAMAMVLSPKLIIADEPTTALDVMAQAQILDLLRRLVDEDGVSLMLITHDLAVMAKMADNLAIMRRGKIIECGPTPALLRDLSHEYSKTLLKSTAFRPLRAPHDIEKDKPILEARHIVCRYEKSGFRAVDDVSLIIKKGENVGLVGESGCGKSTLLRALLALCAPQEGEVLLRGDAFKPGANAKSKAQRKDIQMVFQDPYGSFNPRHKVSRLVAEPFHLEEKKRTDAEYRAAVVEMLQRVGLSAVDADKYPHQFSGGQRQRIAIARALITRPSLVALDEAVSALDVTARARILALLADLSDDLGVSFLFVSHDLGVVRAICDRVLVMRGGKIVEDGPVEEVFAQPRHPYTKALIAATPDLETALAARESRSA